MSSYRPSPHRTAGEYTGTDPHTMINACRYRQATSKGFMEINTFTQQQNTVVSLVFEALIQFVNGSVIYERQKCI